MKFTPPVKVSPGFILAVAVVGIGLGAGQASAAVYLNDTFSDTDYTSQSLPSSAAWVYGTDAASGVSLNASTGSLVLNRSNNHVGIFAYFTASGSPVELSVGETITLSFDVAFSTTSGASGAAGAAAFRWALLDSGGDRVTADFSGTSGGLESGTTFSGWDGYKAQSSVSGSPTSSDRSMITRERTGSQNALFTSAAWTDSGTAITGPQLALGAANVHAASLSLTRTAIGMDIQASFGGVTTAVFSDSTPGTTKFDTVAMFANNIYGGAITFDNVKVEVVPEPGTLGILAIGAIGLLARRRRMD